jgi:hypothetical protein
LPALLHNYSDQLSGELLAHTLEICATIQVSKVAAVSNTAAATLQQLVISVFEKVVAEDGKSISMKIGKINITYFIRYRKP